MAGDELRPQANTLGYLPGQGIPITNALPGWSAYLGGNQIDVIPYDTVSIGGAGVSLHGPPETLPYVLAGNYSVLLPGSAAFATSAVITQSGQIPGGSVSINFLAAPSSNLELTFAGQIIPLTQMATTPTYNILGGEIASFAGQTGELRFTAPAFVGGGDIDNIQFFNQLISEPSFVGLFTLGALLLGWRLGKCCPRNK